MLLMLIVVILN